MKKTANSVRLQRGLATVEMALVTPVLLMILLVTFEFTRAFNQQNTLTKSVRDATRLLSLDGFKGSIFEVTDEDILKAKNLAVYGKFEITEEDEPILEGLSIANFKYDDPKYLSGVIPLEHVQMSVSYVFQPLWPIIPINGKNISAMTLTATSTMRALK